jgi:uncharacterized protein
VVLTGDFLTWDPAAKGAVVQALSALKAPFGVFGCLGNHEIYIETQDSITRLFAAEGIHILRQARMPLQTGGEALNLIGVDFQGNHDGPDWPQRAYLRGVKRLMMPDTANILLNHNPNSFDRAAELGIDLSLAGHTHGGQLSLEFAHRGLALGRWEFPTSRDGSKKPAASSKSTAALARSASPSAWAQDRRLRRSNWCAESETREFGNSVR